MSPRYGFIAVPRAVLESPWYRDASPLARALLMEFLSLANFAPSTTRKGLTLQPGQLVTSWGHLRERLGYAGRGGRREYPHHTNIRRAATFLEKAGEAAYTTAGKAAGGGTVVTLLRWALYAGPPTQAAETTADTECTRYAGIAAPLEQEDLPPAGYPARGKEKHLPIEEFRRRVKEENEREMAETRRIIAEHLASKEGKAGDGTVH